MHTIIKILIFFLLCASPLLVWAQPKDNSPYSRFGLGDLSNQNLIATIGMGGISAAYHDVYHLNIINPASYGFLRSTAFEGGLFANNARLKDEETGNTANVWSGNLTYLQLGFPMKNPITKTLERNKSPFNWAMGFSLLPFSTVGYDLEIETELEGAGTVTNVFEGTGGTYQVLWTNGFSYKNLAVGLNLGYFFGKISNQYEVVFPDLVVPYQDIFTRDFNVSGVIWRGGLQYRVPLSKQTDGKRANLTVGLYGNSKTSFSVNKNELFRRFNPFYVALDTFANVANEEGNGLLPGAWGIGLMYAKGNNFKIGADFAVSNWGQYENDAQFPGGGEDKKGIEDTWKAGFGMEWIPDPTSFKSYFNKVQYRIGGFYRQDYRSIAGDQLVGYGVTLGMGFPIILKQDISFINLALEVGEQGLSNSLHETFINLSLGFTLNDNTWFYKRKFR